MTSNSWKEKEHAYLKALTARPGRNAWTKWAEEMSVVFKKPFNAEQLRSYWRMYIRDTKTSVTPSYKEEVEILGNGSVKSDKLIELSLEQAKDPQYILEAHGFDPNEWEIVSAKSSQWHQHNKQDGTVNLFSSKITVRPTKEPVIDWDEITERVTSKIVPREPAEVIKTSDRFLCVPVFDAHFGNSTLSDYEETLSRIHDRITSGYKEILLIIGGDLLHNDNHRGTTSSGTVIDKVNMTQAWDDAFDYIDSIISKAAEYSQKISLVYVPGNHDEMTGQTVIKALERLYSRNSRVSFDTEQKMFKASMLGNNFIGATHGDKSNRKKYPLLFATQFSQLWGREGVRTREVFTGHLHFEQLSDMDGLMLRQAPTRNKADQWHIDNGFASAHKRFMLVEYDEYEPQAVFYV